MIETVPPRLLIDIGNTRTKWGLTNRGRIVAGEPFPTADFAQPGASHWTDWRDMPPPQQILVANVAGAQVADCLSHWTERTWGLTPGLIQAEAEAHGIRNRYVHAEKLGVDRWVALVAARRAHPGPVCLADCGTAITVDAMDAKGAHLGGVIAPGLMLMRRSLMSGTHALPLAEGSSSDSFARETQAGIRSGTLLAAAGLLTRCWQETATLLGGEPTLLLTGGDAQAIAAVLQLPFEIRPELVLEGLMVIAESS